MTEKVYKYLPARLREAVRRCTELREIYEIRLRASLPLTVASNEGNLIINIKGEPSDEANALYVSEGEISACINLLCEGSAYRHERTMREGFIVTDDGLRAGLSGDLYIPEGGSFSFDSFKGVNIRIPRYITGASEGLIRFFSIHSLSSTLIFSPPGHGKTTLIRELAVRLSRGECSSGGYKRFGKVCVIDHRGEIFPTQSNYCRRGLMLDIISGCTKAKGIDIEPDTSMPLAFAASTQERVKDTAAAAIRIRIIASLN